MKTYLVRIDNDGTKRWYFNEKLHRESGPAVEWANGDKIWFLNGKMHREDGPAIEWSDGKKSWYLNNKKFTEEEFNARTIKPAHEGKVVEIDGVKYTLVVA